MTLLGIVVALTAEGRSLTQQVLTRDQFLHLPEGPLIQLSGMGSKNARLAAEKLIEEGARALVSWGSAGGLIPELLPGTLILPQKILAANGSVYTTDCQWHERLCKRLEAHVDLHKGPLAETPAILTSSSGKTALFERTGAAAADMESAAVAALAHDREVPFAAIRAIVDPAGIIIPKCILPAIDEFGQLKPFSLLKGLLRCPMDILTLISLAYYFRAVHVSLTSVARLTGVRLLAP